MSPLASVSAALHSIIPAPVLSRSCLTRVAVISGIVGVSRMVPGLFGCGLGLPALAPARLPARARSQVLGPGVPGCTQKAPAHRSEPAQIQSGNTTRRPPRALPPGAADAPRG